MTANIFLYATREWHHVNFALIFLNYEKFEMNCTKMSRLEYTMYIAMFRIIENHHSISVSPMIYGYKMHHF